MSQTKQGSAKKSSVKKRLQDAKTAIDGQNFGTARQCCKQALEEDPNSFNALLLLGLCETHLHALKEAEASYQRAIELKPDSPFAWQGLLNVYEAGEILHQYIETAEKLSLIYKDLDDVDRCTAIVKRLMSFVSDKGKRPEKIEMLKFVIPGNPIFEYLGEHVLSPVDSLEKLTDLIAAEEREKIQATINRQRNKLGVNIGDIEREIRRTVYQSSSLELYYRQLLDWSDNEQQRREVEGRLLSFLYNKLLSVPTDAKEAVLSKVKELAGGMLVVKSPVEHAWIIALEWQDFDDFAEIDRNQVLDYIMMFPEAGLARVLGSFLKSDISPYQQTDNDNSQTISGSWDETEILGDLLDGYELRPDSILACRILANYYLHLHEYENTVEMCHVGLKLLDRLRNDTSLDLKKYKDNISLTLATAYIYYQAPRHFGVALNIFDTVLEHDPENSMALIGKALIFEEDGEVERALELLKKIVESQPENARALIEASWCQILLGNHKTGQEGLQGALSILKKDDPSSANERAKIWWRYGKSLWDENETPRSDRSGAYNAFITSLKSSPNYAPSYTSLGVYFAEILGDEERAGKCFSKAFELDATEGEAARHLAEIFAKDREWDLVEVVASRFAEAEKKRNLPGRETAWPFRVLGVSYLQSHDLVKAIQSFQSALRINSNDVNSWIGLGEAYAESGRYVASSKAFARACTLDPDSWYSQFMSGMVHRQTLSFEESKDIFRTVLKSRPEEVVVLDHLSEALVASARENLRRNYYGQAIKDATEALETLRKLSIVHPKSFNLWKNVGDACQIFMKVKAFLQKFPVELVKTIFTVPIGPAVSDMDEIDAIDKISRSLCDEVDAADMHATVIFYYILAYKSSLICCYGNSRTHAVGWFNIACAEQRAYFDFGRHIKYREAAIKCFKKAVVLEPRNAQFWSTYGIATSDYAPLISQHSFIRSLAIDHRQPSTWCNLGALYLAQGDLELANLAFGKAQSTDPDFVASWIGQGLVATAVREEEEAQELFEHSYAIAAGGNKLAMYLFASTSFSTLLSGSTTLRHSPVESILFALEKCLQLEPDFVAAMQIEGLSLESLGNYEYGIEQLVKASQHLEQLYDNFESFEHLKGFVIAKAGLARLYLGQRKFEESLEESLTVIDLSEGEGRLVTSYLSALISAGLSYYFTSDYTNALKMFRLASTETNRDPDVTLFLAQSLLASGGIHRETAQDELFINIENHPQHLKSMLLLGAIGLIDGNRETIDAIESEINDFDIETRMNATPDRSLELLMSCLEGYKDGKPSIRPWLQSALLKPSDHKIWKYLDKKTALETAILDPTISARDLSDQYAAIGTFDNSIKAVFISPGSQDAWLSLQASVEKDVLEGSFQSLKI